MTKQRMYHWALFCSNLLKTAALPRLLAGLSLVFSVATTQAQPPAHLEMVSLDYLGEPGAVISTDVNADGSRVALIALTPLTTDVDNSTGGDLYFRDLSTGEVHLVNKSIDGGTSEFSVGDFAISEDGNFIVYISNSRDIVPELSGATRFTNHVYRYDVETKTNQLVTVNTAGDPADRGGGNASISGDGRFVAFSSTATDLVDGVTDFNFSADVFIYDSTTGGTSLISHVDGDSSTSISGGGGSPSISPDGTHITMALGGQLYLQEISTGDRVLVSRTPAGDPLSFYFHDYSDVSNNGNVVVFESDAPANELDPTVPTDDLFNTDVFAFSRMDNSVTLISRVHNGNVPAAYGGYRPRVSNDGSRVAYVALSNDVLPDGFPPFNLQNQAVIFDANANLAGLVSSDDNGYPAAYPAQSVRISGDGAYTLFVTEDPGLTGFPSLFNTAFLADNAILPGFSVDSDGDGLSDEEELLLGTDPNNPDSDGDFLDDGEEVNVYQTDPLNADTDGDLRIDGKEIRDFTDPNDPDSFVQYPIDVSDNDEDGVPLFVDNEPGSAPGADVYPFPIIVSDPLGDDSNFGLPLDLEQVQAASDGVNLNIIVSYTTDSVLFPDGDTTIEIYADDDPTTGRPSYFADRPDGVDAEVFVDHDNCRITNVTALTLFNPFEQFVSVVPMVCIDNKIFLSIPLGSQSTSQQATNAVSALDNSMTVPDWGSPLGLFKVGASSTLLGENPATEELEVLDTDKTLIGQAGPDSESGITIGGSGIPGSVSGAVWQDNDGDGIRSPGESSVWGNVIVSLTGPGGPLETRTDATGNFLFEGLPTGEYTLAPTAGGFSLPDENHPFVDLFELPDESPRTTSFPVSASRSIVIESGIDISGADFGQAVGPDKNESTQPADSLSTARSVFLGDILIGSIDPNDNADFYSLFGVDAGVTQSYFVSVETGFRREIGANDQDSNLLVTAFDENGTEILPVSETQTEIGSRVFEFNLAEAVSLSVSSIDGSTGYYMVSSENQPPVIRDKGRQIQAYAGNSISIPFAADDEDRSALIWGVDHGITELVCLYTESGNGEPGVDLKCDDVPSQPGEQQLFITATDSQGEKDTDVVILQVNNDPPFTVNKPAESPVEIEEGTTEKIQISAVFNPDVTAPIMLTTEETPEFCGEPVIVDFNTWEYSCSPDEGDSGEHRSVFGVTAQGAGGTTIGGTADIDVLVVDGSGPSNTPPQIQPIEDAFLLETLGLWVDPILIVATDADNDPITLSVTDPDLPDICTFGQTGNGTGEISCSAQSTDQPAGDYLITITASDGNASSTADFTLTIDDALDVEFGIVTPVQVAEGETLSIPFEVVFNPDPSVVPLFSPEALADFCELFDVGDGSGIVECSPQPGDTGEFIIVINVEAAGVIDNFDFTLNVVPEEPPNAPPEADFSYSCNELTCNFQNLSTDDKGLGNLLFAWYFTASSRGNPFPDSIDINPIHTYPSVQVYDVTLKVFDSEGEEDSVTKTVFMAPVDYEIVSIRGLPELRATPPNARKTLVGQKTFTPVITFQNVSDQVGPARVRVSIYGGPPGQEITLLFRQFDILDAPGGAPVIYRLPEWDTSIFETGSGVTLEIRVTLEDAVGQDSETAVVRAPGVWRRPGPPGF